MQQLLLERNIARTRRALADAGIADNARGLDLGCGQGWYLAAMAAGGHSMCGLDRSVGQITVARDYLRRTNVPSAVAVGDATALPYANDTFDFVYCVNAVHHMCAPGAQALAFAEMVRVLRPGGAVLLHEINTENPLFRLYMGYVFPLVRRIDDGTEQWVRPTALPPVAGGAWAPRVDYFTFIPDFAPAWLLRHVDGLEQWLARSSWRTYSAHYLAVFRKQVAEDIAA